MWWTKWKGMLWKNRDKIVNSKRKISERNMQSYYCISISHQITRKGNKMKYKYKKNEMRSHTRYAHSFMYMRS